MNKASLVPGSFRDPKGQVFIKDGKVYRTIMPSAVADYEFIRDNQAMKKFIDKGLVVSATQVDTKILGSAGEEAAYVVEHPRIAFISYPYEWSFSALKAAALFHLEIQQEGLKAGIALSDASAYNIQFNGAKPIFIDYLSFRPYKEGEFWIGHRQFCEQFLNPLLLRAILGVNHNSWYRGNLEGISTSDLARLLPLRKKISWNVLTQVVLQAYLQNSTDQKDTKNAANAIKTKQFSKVSFEGMLKSLHNWISRLEPANSSPSVWGDYADQNSYHSIEASEKAAFIADFTSKVKPDQLWDIGCNSGDYSKIALENGATKVIGFDFDQPALDKAFSRAQVENIDFQAVYLDAANQSPCQGWASTERLGLGKRKTADALINLAFVHHMAITRNIPLEQLIDWLIGFAEQGVIEFVPKRDPMVVELLRLREDIFPNYTEDYFLTCISARAEIIRQHTVTESGRLMVWYKRS